MREREREALFESHSTRNTINMSLFCVRSFNFICERHTHTHLSL